MLKSFFRVPSDIFLEGVSVSKFDRRLAYALLIGFTANLLYFYFPLPALVIRAYILGCIFIAIGRGGFRGVTWVEKSCYLFVAAFTACYIISSIFNSYQITNVANCMIGLLSFPAFGSLARRGAIDQKFIRNALIVLVLANMPHYFYEEQKLLREAMIRFQLRVAPEDWATTVNASTEFLMLLPLCLALRNRKLGLASMIVIVYFLVIAAKRGNIIAGMIPLILFILLVSKGQKNILGKVAILIIIVGAGYWFLSDLIMDDDYLQSRFEQTMEGNSSGRDRIYDHIWNFWYNSGSALNMLFGFGYDASVRMSGAGNFAHNDWLEILVDFGLVGVLCYLPIFISLGKMVLKTKPDYMKYTVLSILTIWGMKSMYSMGFVNQYNGLMAIPYAYVAGYNYIQSLRIKTRKLQAA